MPRHAKASKFKRTLSQNQEPFRSESLHENKFSAALIHHEGNTSAGLVVLEFEF